MHSSFRVVRYLHGVQALSFDVIHCLVAVSCFFRGNFGLINVLFFRHELYKPH
ncbi:hypothetical protein BDW72DRAFT_165292 [Aspergillus terricola var. indicus]